MQLTIDIGPGGWGLLVDGAFVIGVIARWIGFAERDGDWLPVMIGAVVGGCLGSEWIGGASSVGPAWDGLALGPAATVGAVSGGLAALITLVITGGARPNDQHA